MHISITEAILCHGWVPNAPHLSILGYAFHHPLKSWNNIIPKRLAASIIHENDPESVWILFYRIAMAANQGRRRTEQDQNVVVPEILRSSTLYEPLDSKFDCTRFVEIESSRDDSAQISCKHVHIPFSQRPKFVALSYMWGDSNAQKKILLNGVEFGVTENLSSALLHFRRKNTSEDKLFWIDAICINQDDTNEKSQQVRIMNHIYDRASSVVVWLGDRYSKYQDTLRSNELQQQAGAFVPDPPTENIKTSEYIESLNGATQETIMAHSLARDEYWTRLWIIQELGKARLLRVCFGSWEWSWQNFIHFLTMHNIGQESPLRLSRQLRQAPNGTHFLCQLLQDHAQAVCKNNKDKIYGLVGLAADAVGFPIDYSKSLIEIWVDTLEFVNRRGLLPESSFIPFGRLVKSLLMGDNTKPVDQVQRVMHQLDGSPMSLIVQDDDQNSDARVFQFQSYILGCVCNLGPSAQDIVGNLRSVDEWRSKVQSFFRHNLGPANDESNALLRGILESNDDKLASLCLGRVGNVRWTVEYSTSRFLAEHMDNTLRNQGPAPNSSPGTNTTDESDTRVLYQMKHLINEDLPWRMGIVPSQAQRGDLVCWVSGIRNAILVRLMCGGWDGKQISAQVFGTAVVSEDVTGVRFDHEGRVTRLAQRTTSNKPVLGFPVRVDAWTLFALLAD